MHAEIQRGIYKMNNIVIYVTLGMVFAFCAVTLFLILAPEKKSSQKEKKDTDRI